MVGKIVAHPIGGLGLDLDQIRRNASLLPKLAQRRVLGCFAGIDPALRHLPRSWRIDSFTNENAAVGVCQHNPDAWPVGEGLPIRHRGAYSTSGPSADSPFRMSMA